jgi:hypothetical protein
MRGVDEKQAKESKTKGVVGRTGNNTPIAPKLKKTNPKQVRITVFKYK